MNIESNNDKKKKKMGSNNYNGMSNLKNYIQTLSNQGKGMLMSGAIQIITSLRADGLMFEKNFREEFLRVINNIQKELNGKSVDFSIGVLSSLIMIILESAVEKEVSDLGNKREDITNNLLGYI